MIKQQRKRSMLFVFVLLFFGAVCGSVISQFIGLSLPDGVVKDFFLNSAPIGWGAAENNWVNFYVIRFKTGFFVDISVASAIGMAGAWYFLRYFR